MQLFHAAHTPECAEIRGEYKAKLVSVGRSRFDEKESFHLVYKAHNKGRNHSMRDEIRKINDRLLVGLGYVTWSLGRWNPSFFLLYGEAEQWVGPDEE